MTTPLESSLQEIRQRAARARREIYDLASGKRKWEMCVPAQSTDSDFTLVAPVDDIEKLLAVVNRLMAEIKVNTDTAFYEHCAAKVARILEGGE